MTTSMPSGDAAVTDSPSASELDVEAAPTTGLDPDTATDAAGESAASTSADVATGVDPDPGPESQPNAAGAGDGEPAVEAAGESGPARADRTVLDGPALENEEMHRATEDLRSSQDKTATAC